MAFGVLAGQITVIFLEVLLGYVGARSGIIKDRDSKFLSDFIMKLLLPCTMLAGAASCSTGTGRWSPQTVPAAARTAPLPE